MNEINQNLQELWWKVGFIVHLSQMVEYNLANILSADELLREFEEKKFHSYKEISSIL